MGRRYPAWLDALARATLDDDGRRAIRHAWADDVWEAAHIAFGSLTASLDRSADALRAVANAEPILRSRLFAAMRTKRTGTGRQAIDVPTYAGQTWSPPTWRHGPDHSGQASEADATAPVAATGGHTQPTLR
jgi:hypothetical protein